MSLWKLNFLILVLHSKPYPCLRLQNQYSIEKESFYYVWGWLQMSIMNLPFIEFTNSISLPKLDSIVITADWLGFFLKCKQGWLWGNTSQDILGQPYSSIAAVSPINSATLGLLTVNGASSLLHCWKNKSTVDYFKPAYCWL